MATNSTCADPARAEATSEASIWRLVSKRPNEIVALTPGGQQPAFYCIHSVAGDVMGYFELARLLGPDFALFGIQVPKVNMVARSVQSIEMMADRYVRTLNSFQPEGPLVIGGFSAGAIIALEVAQKLRALGRDVPLLVAFDGAPGNTDAGLKFWSAKYLYRLACNAIRIFAEFRPQDASYRRIGRRIFDRLLSRTSLKVPLLRKGQSLDVMAILNVLDRPGWETEYKLFMRAMYEAMYAYVPAPYAGRVVVYELERQPLLHLRQIGAIWSYLAQDCEVFGLSGRHGEFFVTDTLAPMIPHLQETLSKVRRDRDAAPGRNADIEQNVELGEAKSGDTRSLSETTR